MLPSCMKKGKAIALCLLLATCFFSSGLLRRFLTYASILPTEQYTSKQKSSNHMLSRSNNTRSTFLNNTVQIQLPGRNNTTSAEDPIARIHAPESEYREKLQLNQSVVGVFDNQTSSESSISPSESRAPGISMALTKSRPQESNISFHYECRNRSISQQDIDRYFYFTTQLESKVDILIMGDSLAVEFGKGLQIAAGAKEESVLEIVHWGNQAHESLSAAIVRGGGVIAYWRILGFWLQATKNKPLPNKGKGWVDGYLRSLKRFMMTVPRPMKLTFDVLIFRVSHPWLHPDEVHQAGLSETISMAKNRLGVQTTILLTAPVNNNIRSPSELLEFRAMNQRIQDFAQNATTSDVRLCDMEQFADSVIAHNAQALNRTFSEPLFLHKLQGRQNVQSIPMVCAEGVPDESADCRKNYYFNDGMHWCMETLGPRFYAAVGCLLQCAAFDKACETVCNKKFMTLDGLDDERFDSS